MQYIKFSLLFIIIIFISACATQDNAIFSSDSTNKKEVNQRTGEISTINNPNVDLDFSKSKLETIYVAGGCCWGVDAYCERICGVFETESGYANGTGENPTYETVMTGKENFVETVKVTFDPERVTVDELLTYFFRAIDPTVKDQQGNDIGVQYRTGIYYDKNSHKHIIEDEV